MEEKYKICESCKKKLKKMSDTKLMELLNS